MAEKADVQKKVHTLGSVRLRHVATNEVILVPTPSNDVNDPLNWSKGYRYYLAGVVCFAMTMANFLAAGPSVAIVDQVIEFYHAPPTTPMFYPALNKVSFFFTSTALLQGMSTLIWMPILVKFGRRPVYLASTTLYLVCTIWAAFAKSYSSELAARCVLGLGAGSGEVIAPVTIADLFFLHERGLVMAFYTATLAAGVSVGIILSGLITIHNNWRVIYYVTAGLVGLLLLVIFFTMPETAYNRVLDDSSSEDNIETLAPVVDEDAKIAQVESGSVERTSARQLVGQKRTYIQSLRVTTGTYTTESLVRVFIRPVLLLCLPSVLWATLVISVAVGFFIAISTNFATAFQQVYGFKPWQSGLCFSAGVIGCIIGVPAGGWFSDFVADWMTRRNHGIREPEHRLPAIIIGLITMPIGIMLYGVGIGHQTHWIVPTFSLGLTSFAIAAATNVTLVYVVDSYRPVAGEVVVSQYAFKAAFGFLLSFYTNPWVQQSGYVTVFGTMGGICAVVMLGAVPLYFYGKWLRHTTLQWKIFKLAQWQLDREVGE